MVLIAVKGTSLQTVASELVAEVRQNKGEGDACDWKEEAGCWCTYFIKAWQCALGEELICSLCICSLMAMNEMFGFM